MTSRKQMPGGIDESPAKGEPIKPPKHSWRFQSVDPDEPSTMDKWKANVPPDVRTRLQAKSTEDKPPRAPGTVSRTTSTEGKPSGSSKKKKAVKGPGRSGKDGDRPTAGLKTPITDYQTISRTVSLDRPDLSGGERDTGEGSDRPGKTGGDRTETETKESEAEIGDDPKQDLDSIVATQTEEIATGENPESNSATPEDVQTATQEDNVQETTEGTGDPIIQTVETNTPVVNTSDASNEEINQMLNDSTESTPRKESDQKKITPREFIKPKPEEAKGPPIWREFGDAKVWVLPRTRRYEGYSDTNLKSMWDYTKKHDDDMLRINVNPHFTIQDAKNKWQGAELNLKMPPKPEPEPVIRVNAGSIRNDHVTGQPKSDHEAMVDALTEINSTGYTRGSTNPLVSDALGRHTQGLPIPNVLAGTQGMQLVRKQKEAEAKASKRRATYQTPANDHYQTPGKMSSISYGKSAEKSRQTAVVTMRSVKSMVRGSLYDFKVGGKDAS